MTNYLEQGTIWYSYPDELEPLSKEERALELKLDESISAHVKGVAERLMPKLERLSSKERIYDEIMNAVMHEPEVAALNEQYKAAQAKHSKAAHEYWNRNYYNNDKLS